MKEPAEQTLLTERATVKQNTKQKGSHLLPGKQRAPRRLKKIHRLMASHPDSSLLAYLALD